MTTARAAIGWGKVILLGEHAVVYGYPALAAALDRGVRLSTVPAPAGGSLRIEVPAWNLATAAGDDHPVARAIAAIADALAVGRPPLVLIGDAQVAPGAGLGSSAAMAVAAARALLAHAGRPAPPDVIAAAAGASEEQLHGRASGVDVALAIAGGIGVYRKSSGLVPFRVPPLRVLVGPSGEARSTATMIERVATATGGSRDDARMHELGALTDAGSIALRAGDLAGLGAAMNRAHTILADLGVSTPTLDALCRAARVAGAHGAKLTGAGGGGAVIAIAPAGGDDAVLAAWRALGVSGFVANVAG